MYHVLNIITCTVLFLSTPMSIGYWNGTWHLTLAALFALPLGTLVLILPSLLKYAAHSNVAVAGTVLVLSCMILILIFGKHGLLRIDYLSYWLRHQLNGVFLTFWAFIESYTLGPQSTTINVFIYPVCKLDLSKSFSENGPTLHLAWSPSQSLVHAL